MAVIAPERTSIFVDDNKKPRGFDAMINPDPFADVRMSRIFHNNQATDKFLIEQIDEEGAWKPIPGAGTTHGETYILVKNQQVHNLMNEVINRVRDRSEKPIEFVPLTSPAGSKSGPLTWTGKAFSERWFTKDIAISPKVGGKLMLGIEARNSYDNSSKVSVAFYAMAMQCANQFHSSNLFGTPFVVSHFGQGGDLMDNVGEIMDGITWSASHFLEILPSIDRLCDCRLRTVEKYYKFLDKCEKETGLSLNDKKLRQEICGNGTTAKVKDLVNPGAYYGAPDSLWSLANAFSAIETHENPGLGGIGKIERFFDFCLRESRANDISEFIEDAVASSETIPLIGA